MELLLTTKAWLMNLGVQYGVNPIVFAVIYVGAIPFFTLSMGWLIKNIKQKRSTVLPLLSSGFFFISAYLYLIIAGKNVPAWVYAAILLLVGLGAYSAYKKMKRQLNEPDTSNDL